MAAAPRKKPARAAQSAQPARPAAPADPAPLALYRKYRPATFAEVKGQDHVTQPLRQALRNGRIHHAYLFSGPRGCGKTSCARILARSLNCEQGPTPDPCGKCASCVALGPAGPGSIDVIEIDAASHGGVDDARELRERAFYAPVSSRFKVYIIDEAHMVTSGGFNALLKLVEEPPAHLKFVFATTEPDKVIATIRSRTHHYPFRLVPPAVLRELLEEILHAEKMKYQPAVLPLVVRAGAGSVRDALSVLDQLLAGAGKDGLTYDRTLALLGYTDDRLLDEVVDALGTGDGAAVFTAVDRMVEAGHDPRRFATDLLDRLRDLIILAAVPGAGESGLLDVPADRLERMAKQTARFGQAELTRAAEIVNEGLIQMRGTTAPRLLLELMCAQVLLPASSTGETAILTRLDRLEHQLEGGQNGGARRGVTAPPGTQGVRPQRPGGPPERRGEPSTRRGESSAQPAEPPAPALRPQEPSRRRPGTMTGVRSGAGPVDASLLHRHWPEILEAVRNERKVAWILLNTATVQDLAGEVLTIAFPSEGNAKGFTGSGHDQVLAGVLAARLGLTVRVRAVAEPRPIAGGRTDTSAPRSGAPANRPAGDTARPAGGSAGGGAGGQPEPPGRPHRDAARQPDPPGEPTAPARGRQSTPSQRRAHSDPSSAPAGEDGEEWPDDAGAAGAGMNDPTGMELIRRQLGGSVIAEIDEE